MITLDTTHSHSHRHTLKNKNPHHINIQNITITWTRAHYSALITHSHFTFGKKTKYLLLQVQVSNTYSERGSPKKKKTHSERVRKKEIPVGSGVDGRPVNGERRGATGQALGFQICDFSFSFFFLRVRSVLDFKYNVA